MTVEGQFSSLSPESGKLLKKVEPISFDLDGVCVDLAPLALARFNRENGTTFTLFDIEHPYIMDKWYMAQHGVSAEEASVYTTSIWNSEECLEGAGLVSGISELLNHLDEHEIRYKFITSRPFSVFSHTQNWFNKNQISHRFSQVLMQTSPEYNRKHKVETIRNWQVKVHFEDMAQHAMDIVENTEALVVLVNYPANHSLPDHPRIIRPQNRNSFGNIQASYLALLDYLVGRQILGV